MNRTFSEQLVSEWLQLNGWFVQDGVILGSKAAGGRDEADIVAIKRFGEKLKVLHVEVGTLPGGAKRDLETIERKFSKNDAIISYVGKRLGEEPEYDCRYIAVYASSKAIDLIREKNYRIDRLEDVIQNEILPDVINWKRKEVLTRRSKQLPTPPNNLWMIQLVDFIAYHGIDLSPYWRLKK